MADLLQDLRLGLRALGRSPVLTILATLLLALGIGSTTAIFTVIDAVMLRPLRVSQPERLVQVWDEYPASQPGVATQIAPLNFADYESQNRVFEHIAAIGRTTAYGNSVDGLERVRIEFVSPDLFSILEIEPALGRLLQPEDNTPGAAPVIVLPYEIWQSKYGGDPGIVGQTVAARYYHHGPDPWPRIEFEIVGVLEPGYRLPPMKFDRRVARYQERDWIVPMGMWRWGQGNRGMWALGSLALLAPGVSVEQANADLESISAGIAQANPKTSAGYSARVTRIDSQLRQAYGPRLLLLWSAAGFVLILGCANVASLLFGRSLARERELSVRSALGAGRGRLISYLLLEGALLAVAGAGLGIALAEAGRRLLVSLMPGAIPGIEEASLDLHAYGFSVAVALATTLLCGLIPALQGSRPNVALALRADGRGSSATGLLPLRLLVVVESAITVLLLVGAGLMASTFLNFLKVDPGFETERILSLEISKPPRELSKYQSSNAEAALFDRLRERLEALPEVIAVAYVNLLPLGGREYPGDITLTDRPPPAPEARPMAAWLQVSPGYFEMMKVPLIAGRTFTHADLEDWLRNEPSQQESPEEEGRRERESMQRPIPVIVNQTFAERFWPSKSALGERFHWGTQNPDTVLVGNYEDGSWDTRYPVPIPLEIVGVVGDVMNVGLDAVIAAQYYTPEQKAGTLIVQLRTDSPILAHTLTTAIAKVDPAELTVTRITPLRERFSDAIAVPRFQMALVVFFAATSILMAVAGLFGVMAYSIRRRQQEIGVRIALGARPVEVRNLVLREGLLLTAAGLVIGAGTALALSRLVGGLLFGVSPTEPIVFLAAGTLLLAVAAGACWWPARRAVKIDPVEVLRQQ